jgi:predicted flap endonuclease-1-like 5' DNA nuclease
MTYRYFRAGGFGQRFREVGVVFAPARSASHERLRRASGKGHIVASYAIAGIEGIEESQAEALRAAGVATAQTLLERGSDPKGRRALAEEAGIAEAQILRWVNIADLLRIHGVGKEYSDLLEAAGVDTVKELKHRNPANLTKALAEANEKGEYVRALPTEKVVAKWIEQAKELPPIVTY